MLSLTRKVDYALVALAGLAEADASSERPVSSSRLADEYGLPSALLIKVLKRLHRAGIVESERGVHGGYYLADKPEAISLVRVFEAIEGPIDLMPCCGDGQASEDSADETCRLTPRCPISRRIRELSGRVNDYFRQVTLRDLISPEADPTPIRVPLTARREVATG